jgi:hypothetical protein
MRLMSNNFPIRNNKHLRRLMLDTKMTREFITEWSLIYDMKFINIMIIFCYELFEGLLGSRGNRTVAMFIDDVFSGIWKLVEGGESYEWHEGM